HPLACAAGLATLDVYRDENVFASAKALEPKWCDAVMGLKGLPNVLDIRCVGLTAGIDLAPAAGGPGLRGLAALDAAFHEHGAVIRISGDTLELTPPLVMSEAEMGEIVDKTGKSIRSAA
ncbi:MAG: aminotransferase class III-fold pyridoxal phosphate-dependent enzyme, partial [Hyphomicrobiales bacterium]|nr:aminotransferase class III-fold pyridoxal phosphate-dependent enzyme [Hyphomicrobiales bacterium]